MKQINPLLLQQEEKKFNELYYKSCVEAKSFIEKRLKEKPDIAVVLGSGLGGLISNSELLERKVIPYKEIPNFPQTSVAGHEGSLIMATLDGHKILFLSGRTHYYESLGWAESPVRSMKWLTLPYRVLKGLGVKSIITTCAVGAIQNAKKSLKKGDIGIIVDHTSMLGLSPLMGLNDPRFGVRFSSKKQIYSLPLLQKFLNASKKKTPFCIYITAPQSPQYEGIADLLRSPVVEGYITVQGMSYGIEEPVINHSNADFDPATPFANPVEHLGLAVFTNIIESPVYKSYKSLAKGESFGGNSTSHEEVKREGQKAESEFVPLMIRFLKSLY